MQEHVFSAQHINRIRSILENGEQTGSEHLNANDDATNDDDHDMTSEDKRNPDQLQQLKNFKTKSPIAIDPASDKLGFYNQFLLQNNMLGTSESSDNTANNVAPDSFLNILRMQQMQQQQKPTQNNQPGQSSVENNGSNGLENNLLLQINTDKASNATTTNNNEILQQLYNYSQMSGKLIK